MGLTTAQRRANIRKAIARVRAATPGGTLGGTGQVRRTGGGGSARTGQVIIFDPSVNKAATANLKTGVISQAGVPVLRGPSGKIRQALELGRQATVERRKVGQTSGNLLQSNLRKIGINSSFNKDNNTVTFKDMSGATQRIVVGPSGVLGELKVRGRNADKVIFDVIRASELVETRRKPLRKAEAIKRAKEKRRKEAKFLIGRIPERGAKFVGLGKLTSDQKKVLLKPRAIAQLPLKRRQTLFGRILNTVLELPRGLQIAVDDNNTALRISFPQVTGAVRYLDSLSKLSKQLGVLKKDKPLTKTQTLAINKELRNFRKNKKIIITAINNYKSGKTKAEVRRLLNTQESKMLRNFALFTAVTGGAGLIGGVTLAVVETVTTGFFSVLAGKEIIKAVKEPTVENITRSVIFTIPTLLGIHGTIKGIRSLKVSPNKLKQMESTLSSRLTANNRLLRNARKARNFEAIRILRRENVVLRQGLREGSFLRSNLNFLKTKNISRSQWNLRLSKLRKSYATGIHKNAQPRAGIRFKLKPEIAAKITKVKRAVKGKIRKELQLTKAEARELARFTTKPFRITLAKMNKGNQRVIAVIAKRLDNLKFEFKFRPLKIKQSFRDFNLVTRRVLIKQLNRIKNSKNIKQLKRNVTLFKNTLKRQGINLEIGADSLKQFLRKKAKPIKLKVAKGVQAFRKAANANIKVIKKKIRRLKLKKSKVNLKFSVAKFNTKIRIRNLTDKATIPLRKNIGTIITRLDKNINAPITRNIKLLNAKLKQFGLTIKFTPRRIKKAFVQPRVVRLTPQQFIKRIKRQKLIKLEWQTRDKMIATLKPGESPFVGQVKFPGFEGRTKAIIIIRKGLPTLKMRNLAIDFFKKIRRFKFDKPSKRFSDIRLTKASKLIKSHLDPIIKSFTKEEVILHELLHLKFPKASEKSILIMEQQMAKSLQPFQVNLPSRASQIKAFIKKPVIKVSNVIIKNKKRIITIRKAVGNKIKPVRRFIRIKRTDLSIQRQIAKFNTNKRLLIFSRKIKGATITKLSKQLDNIKKSITKNKGRIDKKIELAIERFNRKSPIQIEIIRRTPLQRKTPVIVPRRLKFLPKKGRQRILRAIRKDQKFLKTPEGRRLVKRLQREKTRGSRLDLERERRLLRKQQSIEQRLLAGKQVKAPRDPGTSKGFPFEDAVTKKVRFFKSRKDWLRAIKLEVKNLRKVKGEDQGLVANLVRLRKKAAKDIKQLKPQNLINDFNNIERIRKQIAQRKVKVKKSPFSVKARLKEIKNLNNADKKAQGIEKDIQGAGQKAILKLKEPKLETLKTKLKAIQKVKTRTQAINKFNALAGLIKIKKDAIGLKLRVGRTLRLGLLMKIAKKESAELKDVQVRAIKAKQSFKIAQKPAQKIKAIPKVKQLPKAAQDVVQKTGVGQVQAVDIALRLRNISRARARTIIKKIPKLIPLVIKQLDKPQALTKAQIKKLKKLSDLFLFRADLISVFFNIRATPKQRRQLLRVGRIFTGLERRPVVTRKFLLEARRKILRQK